MKDVAVKVYSREVGGEVRRVEREVDGRVGGLWAVGRKKLGG